MKKVIGTTIVDVWINAVKAIINEGKNIIHEGKNTREISNLILNIESPLDLGEPSEEDADFLFSYLINPLPADTWFSEYSRIFDYYGMNQMELIIEKLKNKPDSRSATISLIEPKIDLANHFTCLSLINYKTEKNRLNATCIYRSHDYGGKAYSNLAFQGKLMRCLCEELKIKPGTLTCHSISAHIYLPQLK
ncbi:MAG: thymidylate synthase [archaeon]